MEEPVCWLCLVGCYWWLSVFNAELIDWHNIYSLKNVLDIEKLFKSIHIETNVCNLKMSVSADIPADINKMQVVLHISGKAIRVFMVLGQSAYFSS